MQLHVRVCIQPNLGTHCVITWVYGETQDLALSERRMEEVPHDTGFGRKISQVRGHPIEPLQARLHQDMNQCSEVQWKP